MVGQSKLMPGNCLGLATSLNIHTLASYSTHVLSLHNFTMNPSFLIVILYNCELISYTQFKINTLDLIKHTPYDMVILIE